MKTQIIIATLFFLAPLFIIPKVVEAGNNRVCVTSVDEKGGKGDVKKEGCCAAKVTESNETQKACCQSAEKKSCTESQSANVKKCTGENKTQCSKDCKKECCKTKNGCSGNESQKK